MDNGRTAGSSSETTLVAYRVEFMATETKTKGKMVPTAPGFGANSEHLHKV